jgi:HK97 family phage major capsid protein
MSLFTRKEISRFSVTKCLAELAEGSGEFDGEVSGLELECDQAIKSHARRTTGTEPVGFQIPIAALAPVKAQNVTTFSAGGALVDESLDDITAALRPASVVLSLGARVFSNLTSDLALPSETSFPAASWLSESQTLQDPSDAVYAKTVLKPHRCASLAILSKQLLACNSVGVEQFVRRSLADTLASAIDKAALSGAGNVEPLGLINNPAISTTVSFSGAATRAKLVAFQDGLTAANAGNLNQDSLAYVTTPTSSSKLAQAVQVTGQARFLWEGSLWSGNVCGLPARATTNAGSGNLMICGDWSKLVVAFWADSLSIISDSFTQKKAGIVEFYSSILADCAPSNAANFVVSTDSAAQ